MYFSEAILAVRSFGRSELTKLKIKIIIFEVTFIVIGSYTKCLETPNGQVPVYIFTPTFNTTMEIVAAMAATGEYAKVQVIANSIYIFQFNSDRNDRDRRRRRT